MNTYPEVMYPESLSWLKQSNPTVKEIFGIDAPVSKESSPLTYIGILVGSFLVTLVISLAVGSFINFVLMPVINSFTSKNDYRMTEFGSYFLFGLVYISCAITGFRFFLSDDKTARIVYNRELTNYTRLSQDIKSHIVLLNFKHGKIREIMAKSGSLLDGSDARQGVAESAFFDYLLKNFPANVAGNFIRGLSIDFDNQHGTDVKLYTPDIIYQDPNLKFRLDIEIDEPYIGSSRQPIHFLKPDGYSKDYFRDQTFLHNNWTIIKFSEEQVVTNPNACLDYIDEVIRNIYSVLLLEPDFKKPTTAKWTEEEAKMMAVSKNREKYLGITFSSKKYSDNDLPF